MYKLIEKILLCIFYRLDNLLHKNKTYQDIYTENISLKIQADDMEQLVSERDCAENELFQFKINYVKNEVEKITDFINSYLRWDNSEEIYNMISKLDYDRPKSYFTPPDMGIEREKYYFNAVFDILDYLEYVLKSNPRYINKKFIDEVYKTNDLITDYTKRKESNMENLNNWLKNAENHYSKILGQNFYNLSAREWLEISEILSRFSDNEITVLSNLIMETDKNIDADFIKASTDNLSDSSYFFKIV